MPSCIMHHGSSKIMARYLSSLKTTPVQLQSPVLKFSLPPLPLLSPLFPFSFRSTLPCSLRLLLLTKRTLQTIINIRHRSSIPRTVTKSEDDVLGSILSGSAFRLHSSVVLGGGLVG